MRKLGARGTLTFYHSLGHWAFLFLCSSLAEFPHRVGEAVTIFPFWAAALQILLALLQQQRLVAGSLLTSLPLSPPPFWVWL